MGRPNSPQKSTQQLNDALVNFLEQLCDSGIHGFINGDAYDTWFSESLRDHLNASLITTQEFDGTNDRSHDPTKMKYSDYKQRCASRVFDFRDIDALRQSKGLPVLGDGTYIIDKPNGKQAWPDMLLVHRGVGLPIEMKSAKSQKPVWNNGIPVKHGLYVFTHNKKKTKTQPKKSETVFYFGEQVIDDFEISALKAIEDVTSIFNIKIKSPNEVDERWKYYARAMNNHLVNFFKASNQAQLSNTLVHAKQKIGALSWDSEQTTCFPKSTRDSVDDSFDFIREHFPKAFQNLAERVQASQQREHAQTSMGESETQRAALSVVANLVSSKAKPSASKR